MDLPCFCNAATAWSLISLVVGEPIAVQLRQWPVLHGAVVGFAISEFVSGLGKGTNAFTSDVQQGSVAIWMHPKLGQDSVVMSLLQSRSGLVV